MSQAKGLSDIEEEVVYISEPETGETLSDEEERSSRDLIDCQEGRDANAYC
jgi:hypothetical protein